MLVESSVPASTVHGDGQRLQLLEAARLEVTTRRHRTHDECERDEVVLLRADERATWKEPSPSTKPAM